MPTVIRVIIIGCSLLSVDNKNMITRYIYIIYKIPLAALLSGAPGESGVAEGDGVGKAGLHTTSILKQEHLILHRVRY